MKLVINDIEADGVVGDVAMTLTADNLSEIVTKNGSYSNTFELDITNTNRRIWESAESVISFSGNAYRKLPAKIIIDGLEVVTGFCVLKGSKSTYKVAIFSGNSEFHLLIKDFDITTIKSLFDSLDHGTTITDINNRRYNTTDLIYPNIDYGHFERWSLGFTSVPQGFFFYCVYVKFIIDAVIENLGYRKEGSFWDGDVYQNLAIPCNRVRDKSVFFVQAGLQVDKGDFTSGTIKYFEFNVLEDEDSKYIDTAITGLGTIKAYNFYENPTDNRFEIELSGQFKCPTSIANNPLFFELRALDKATGALVTTVLSIEFTLINFYPNFPIPEYQTYSVDGVVYSVTNISLIDYTTDVLVWALTSPNASTVTNLYTITDLNFKITETLSASDPQNRVFKSLPNFKIVDLYKSMLPIDGAFTIVDEYTKKIRTVYYDEIKQNIVRAYDWSDLIDLSEEPEINYRFSNYGQENVFKYENDENDIYIQDDVNLGRGTLDVSDQTLEKSKDIVSIPFSLCSIGLTAESRLTMAKIYTGEKYVYNSDTFEYDLDPDAKVDKVKPRLVKLTDSSSEIYIDNVAIASRDVSNSISFDNVIPLRYSLFSDITNKTKIVRALFRLKVSDVYAFDFSRPVFVGYFGEYFFVNKIEQFKFNVQESTMCELIRL